MKFEQQAQEQANRPSGAAACYAPDTPESNAAAFQVPNYDQPVVPLYVAQKLERERNEARRFAERWAARWSKTTGVHHADLPWESSQND